MDYNLLSHDNQRLKQLVSTLNETSLALCDSLQYEHKNNEARQHAISTVYEADEIEESIRNMTTKLESEIKLAAYSFRSSSTHYVLQS